MTPDDRITQLEARIAALEARLSPPRHITPDDRTPLVTRAEIALDGAIHVQGRWTSEALAALTAAAGWLRAETHYAAADAIAREVRNG